MGKKISKRQKQYLANKDAKVGDIIKCCVCGKEFVKRQYAQAFCSSHCKDVYWNAKNNDRHSDADYYRKYNNKIEDIGERKRRVRYAVENSFCFIGDGYVNQNEFNNEVDKIMDEIFP